MVDWLADRRCFGSLEPDIDGLGLHLDRLGLHIDGLRLHIDGLGLD
jgi:hypothetical protein